MEANKTHKVLVLISGIIHTFFGILMVLISLMMNLNKKVFMDQIYEIYTEEQLQEIAGISGDPFDFIFWTIISIGIFFIIIAIITLFGFFSINKNLKRAGILLITSGVISMLGFFFGTGFLSVFMALIFNIYPGIVFLREGKNKQSFE